MSWSGLALAVGVLVCFAASFVLTGRLRGYALSRNLVDEVNPRSSHTRPTPRGGGIAIVTVSLAGFALALFAPELPSRWVWGLLVGGGAVAAIGWIDDHGHVAARWRMLVHLAAAAWAVAFIGPLPLGEVLPQAAVPAITWPLSILMVGWLVNVFNFMDGIDGIAGSETASAALFGALILLASGSGDPVLAWPWLALAASTLGFLAWNWPPAKIFMGDAGSGFIGYVLAALVLIAGSIDAALGVAMAILLALFLCDASVTLIRRMLRRDPLHQAHRTHAYQLVARRVGHRPVTVAFIALNTIFLLPLAWLVAAGSLSPLVGATAAYAPLALAAWLLGGGRAEA